MYEHVLRRMQRAVKAGKIRFRRHALEELANEGFVPHDAVNCIITGQIVEDQFDLVYQQTKLPSGEWFPAVIRLNADGDGSAFFGLNWDVVFDFREYKKFATQGDEYKLTNPAKKP